MLGEIWILEIKYGGCRNNHIGLFRKTPKLNNMKVRFNIMGVRFFIMACNSNIMGIHYVARE